MSETKDTTKRRSVRDLTPEQRRRLLELRRRKRLKKRLRVAVPALALAAVAILALALIPGRHPDKTGGGMASEVSARSEAAESSAEPTAQPTAAPTPTRDPSTYVPEDGIFRYSDAYIAALSGAKTGPMVTTNLSDVDAGKLARWPAAQEGYLPLLFGAENVTEKVVAVTVDDCFQAGNLRQIVQCALDNSARLTIFPIGRNLESPEVVSAVKWAWENGMEIENHTYSHGGTYHYDDEKMTNDIWYQSYLLNQALGVNYEQHFYRPKGGDERHDQRAHAYASQLGMRGFAMWSASGSAHAPATLLADIKPGDIFLFHTTDKDLGRLLEFIPAATQMGYRLVTLNELFGLPDNRTSELNNSVQVAPRLESFQVVPEEMKRTSYMRAAATIQERLIELGWMKGEPTGVYGDSTRASMMLFQAASGIKPDGVASQEVQRALFALDAPEGTLERVKELGVKFDSTAKKAIIDMFR